MKNHEKMYAIDMKIYKNIQTFKNLNMETRQNRLYEAFIAN